MSKLNDDQFGPRQRAWLEALESGQFQQVKHSLHTSFGYCCLGIACELSGLGQWEKRGGADEFEYLGDRSTLPNLVQEHFAFYGDCGESNMAASLSFYTALAKLNDSNYTFEQIAERVRRNPNCYFTEKK